MFPLPAELVAAVEQDPDPARRAWFASLPETVAELCDRWAVTVGPPFQPGGQCSWVAPARDRQGRDLVVKVGWWHTEAAHEAAGLLAWRERGAVEVLASADERPTSAMLLERARPGTPLGELLPGPDQDLVLAQVLRELWHEPAAGHPFRPLTQLCDFWAESFERDVDPAVMDPGLAAAGMELFRGLPREPGPQLLLATDLHAGNLLAARRRPWLLIDPKPYVGDPYYDVLQHLFNEEERLTLDPIGLVGRMAALLDLDADRLRRWMFARAVQESIDTPWLRPVARELAP